MTSDRLRADTQGVALRQEAGRLGWTSRAQVEGSPAASSVEVAKSGAPTALLMDLASLVQIGAKLDWWLDHFSVTYETSQEPELVATLVGGRRILAARATAAAAARRSAAGQRSGRRPAIAPAVVARMVESRSAGHGYRAIAAELEAAGIPTVSGGRRWHPSTVRAALLREGVTD